MTSPARATVAAMLLTSVAAAGCLGGGPEDGTGADDELVDLVQVAAATCDRPLLDERVRAREVDLATDPNDPSHLVATMMVPWPTQYPLAPYDAMGWTGIAQSDDGGRTWTYAPLSGYPGDPNAAASPFAGALFAGDPYVQFLPDGSVLLAVMIIYPPFTVTLQVAKFPWGSFEPEFVTTLSNGALGPGLHDVPTTQPLMHNDYEKMLVDPVTGDAYLTWSYRWQQTASAIAVFAKSTDGGRTWTDPIPFSPIEPHYLAAREHQMDPWPLVTAEGQLVIVWLDWNADTLYITGSPDGGATFEERRSIGEWPGLGFAASTVDLTGGPRHGTIYVALTHEGGGSPDLYVLTSTDHGQTWTEGTRVNEGVQGSDGRERMPDLIVEPDGAVSVLYMSDVESPEDVHAFVARSTDGGATFTNHRVSREGTSPSAINNQPFFLTHLGDYIGITYNEDGIVAAWQDGRESTPDVPYSEAWMCELPTRAAG